MVDVCLMCGAFVIECPQRTLLVVLLCTANLESVSAIGEVPGCPVGKATRKATQ
jgi:hypothetical protein